MKKNKKDIIFGLSNGREIANYIASKKDISLGIYEEIKFSDGELLLHSKTSVRNKNVYIVQSLYTSKNRSVNDCIMELLLFIDAIKRANARSIHAIIPYFAYARQDRKTTGRHPISSKLLANLLETAGVTRITVCDLHSPQIQGFFNIPVDNLLFDKLLINYLNKNYKKYKNDFVIVSPDFGRIKIARKIANILKCKISIIHKDRDGKKVSSDGILGNVNKKVCILIDDIVNTGNTALQAINILKKANAKKIIFFTSHSITTPKTLDKIFKSGIEKYITTNTIKINKNELKNMDIISINEYILKVVVSWKESESISGFYKETK